MNAKDFYQTRVKRAKKFGFPKPILLTLKD